MKPTTQIRVASLVIFGLLAVGLESFAATPSASAKVEQPVRRLDVVGGQELFKLCESMDVPCGLEESADDNLRGSASQRIHYSTTTARQILDGIIKKHPSYKWDVTDSMIHLRYSGSPKNAFANPLDKKLDKISINEQLSLSAIQNVFRQAGIKAGFTMSGDPRFAVISIDAENIAVRDALDMIAKADGKIVWSVVYNSGGDKFNYTVYSWRHNEGKAIP